MRADVGQLPVGDNVGLLSSTAIDNAQRGYADGESANVGVLVGQNSDLMSITNQEEPKTRETAPLNPPTGDFSPQGEALKRRRWA